ncbi:MAG: hypothetical protein Q9217_001920, partial [Psora testacea]
MNAVLALCAFVLHLSLVATIPLDSGLSLFSRRQNIQYNQHCDAPGYGRFACVTCDDTALRDETLEPEDKWAAADGDAAWDSIKRWWTVQRDAQGGTNVPNGVLGSVQGFVPEISWFWQGPEFLNCADIGETHCDDVVNCEDANIPAASMILTSFANINMVSGLIGEIQILANAIKFYNNLYDGIKDAQSSIRNNIGHFTSNFAPQERDTLKALKLMLDIASLMYVMIGAGVWNKILKETRMFKNRGDDHSWAKDSANSFVASGIILAKDAHPTPQGAINTQNDISTQLGALIDGWSEVTVDYVSNLFSGTDAGLEQLDAYIKGGDWCDPGFTNSRPELQTVMENVVYGGLIQKAWQAHSKTNPVIIFQQGFDNTNPMKPLKENPGGLDDKDAIAARTQYDGTTLWLLDTLDPCRGQTGDFFQAGSCTPGFLKPLSGASQLTPGNPWGGVLLDDITIRPPLTLTPFNSAFTGWQLNGDKNGYVMPEDSKLTDASGQDADLPFEIGIRTPGFFSSIPICDIETVQAAARPLGN